MNLVRWNPRREMATFGNSFNRLFNDPFFSTRWVGEGEDLETVNWKPVVDIYDQDETMVVQAELPGLDKNDVHVDVKDRVLTLRGERKHDNEVKEDHYYRKERFFGQFQRSFTLSADVNPDKIKAEFKDGILKIEIPKPEEQKPKKIAVH